MTTEERLERLERELARMRTSTRWLLAGLVLTLCLMAGVVGLTPKYGRYAISEHRILDTSTGHLWWFEPDADAFITDCGTLEHPKFEERKVRLPRTPVKVDDKRNLIRSTSQVPPKTKEAVPESVVVRQPTTGPVRHNWEDAPIVGSPEDTGATQPK